MAEATRMATADVVAKVLAGEHGDFVREAVALVARELMEAEISVEVGCGARRGLSPAQLPSQGLSPQAVGDAGRGDRAVDPEKAPGPRILPELPRAPQALRAGDRRGRAGGPMSMV
jgi:hypothetical protein